MAKRATKDDGRGARFRVFLKRDAQGNWRARWYGRWMVEGKSRETSLCEWRGTPPGPDATAKGLALFEQSRERARQQLKKAIDGRQDADEELRDAQKIHALRYGYRVARVKISELAARWDALPHKANLTEGRRDRVHFVLKRFVDFMEGYAPGVKDAGALTAEHFKAFLADVDASGVSARTWNDYMEILRGVLRKVDGNSRGFREYLAGLPKRTERTIHRRPFEGTELDAILAAASEIDPALHPVLVAAACTALRRGDVCKLRWEAVDLAENFVTVKTSKTGETVDIPIFPPFRTVLDEAAKNRKKGVPYVWPKIALAYARNPDGLNIRLRRVLAAAGFVTPERLDTAGGKYDAPEDEDAAAAMVEDGMEREGWTAKRKVKARRILTLHFAGKNGKEIAEEIGTSKGGVSDYLHAMEDAGHVALISPPKRDTPVRATLAEIPDGEQRKQRGSLSGFHAFRTTFCTLALANGVPMEILRRITGHRTAEIVLKHYDRRGREETRKAFTSAMPKAIVGAIGDGGAREADKARKRRGKAKGKELVALPSELAGIMSKATPEQLAKVAEMLQKGGEE